MKKHIIVHIILNESSFAHLKKLSQVYNVKLKIKYLTLNMIKVKLKNVKQSNFFLLKLEEKEFFVIHSKDIIKTMLDFCMKKNLKITTSESCTGGLIASKITSYANVSSIFDLGLITYANEMKQKILKVKDETLDEYGAVSSYCIKEMLFGSYELTSANICIATSGIAGPSGGSNNKPVGMVFVGILYNGKKEIKKCLFRGNRKSIQKQAMYKAFEMLINAYKSEFEF